MRLRSKPGGLKTRLRSLETLHTTLETRIETELKRPLPDAMLIQKLKRLKLRAKDEIASITGVLRTIGKENLIAAA